MEMLNELIDLLKNVSTELLSGKLNKFEASCGQIINISMELFPKIIVSYSDPKMEDLREDATYWPMQLERVINTIQGKDIFAMYDVLYCETRANLIGLKQIYMERAIEL